MINFLKAIISTLHYIFESKIILQHAQLKHWNKLYDESGVCSEKSSIYRSMYKLWNEMTKFDWIG